MIVLNVQNVRKYFGPEPVLDGVSFEVRPGERIGLVGPNGAGKTTLLKILAGKEEADAGRTDLHPSLRMAYLEQQPEVVAGRTLWQEAHSVLDELIDLQRRAEEASTALGQATDPAEHERIGKLYDRLQHELHARQAYHLDHHVERVLQGLGFGEETYEQPLVELSGGQINRLMLAKLLLAQPDLMLLDEPSNHLDIGATEWLENFLAESQQAMLVVSHDRYFLDRVTNRTLELFHATVDSYVGNFTAYWRQKAERLEVQRRTYDRQQEEIAKNEDFIRRNAYGQKSTQAKDREKKLARIERIDPPREIAGPVMGFPAVERTGDLVFRVEHLAKAYDRPLFADLSFDILRGERWGILGPNGCGKTTLLRCLIGQESATAGRVGTGTGVKVGYFDQQLTGLAEDSLVVDSIRPPHKQMNEPQRRNMLARFGLTGDMVFQTVGSLSGGERNRTALARLAASDANVLVLDEPTNHLDLWARAALERSLKNFDGTVLFVSHDRYFLNQVADHLLVVEPGRFRVVEGNYDAYRFLLSRGLFSGEATDNASSTAHAASASAEKGKSADKNASPAIAGHPGDKPKRKRKFSYRKVAEIEAEIQKRESRIEELHQLLADPDTLRNGDKVKAAMSEVDEQRATLRTLYEHWEEAAEMN